MEKILTGNDNAEFNSELFESTFEHESAPKQSEAPNGLVTTTESKIDPNEAGNDNAEFNSELFESTFEHESAPKQSEAPNGLENKPADSTQPQHLAAIKMKSKQTVVTQNDSTQTILETNGDKSDLLKEDGSNVVEELTHEKKSEKYTMIDMQKSDSESQDLVGNNLPKEKRSVQTIVSNVRRRLESYDSRNKALKIISRELENKIKEISEIEQAKVNNKLAEKSIDWNKVENQCTLLSEEFRMGNERPTIGLQTESSRDGDSFKFQIIGTREGRNDLKQFTGLTISIKGLDDNKTLTNFISAVGVVGFQKAVEYVNSLDNSHKVELALLDKEGNKIEGERLEDFKRLSVPQNQLKDSNTSKEEQHIPTSYLNFIKNEQNTVLNSNMAAEEDSDIGEKEEEKGSFPPVPKKQLVDPSLFTGLRKFIDVNEDFLKKSSTERVRVATAIPSNV